jgi:hypothetical protein
MTTETNSDGNSFRELLDQLSAHSEGADNLQKALDGCAGKKPNPKGLKKGDEGWEDGMEEPERNDGELLEKAFKVVLPDGTETEALDATDILKALNADVGTIRTGVLPQVLAIMGKQQNMLKALVDEVKELRGQPTPRRSTITLHEKNVTSAGSAGGGASLAKAEGMTAGEFMLKAEAAFDAGRISGVEARHVNLLINRGVQPDPELVAKILGNAS